MAENTAIEWLHGMPGYGSATWNPTTGCSAAGPGCKNCYAKDMTYRLERMGVPKYTGLTVLNQSGSRHFNGVVRTHDDVLEKPLRWNKPRVIFVNSMSDLFHEDVPDDFIARVFAIMGLACWHRYIILTKRSERMAELMSSPDFAFMVEYAVDEHSDFAEEVAGHYGQFDPSDRRHGDWRSLDHSAMPMPHVALGVSVSTQACWNEHVPNLIRTPAAVRVVSAEPLLGEVDLSNWLPRGRYYNAVCEHCGYAGTSERFIEIRYHDDSDVECPKCHNRTVANDIGQLHQIIVGGESGPKARPMHPEWARGIRDQCVSAGVPFFFKQWGAWAPIDMPWEQNSPKGCAHNETWLNLAGGSGFHGDSVWRMRHSGKKSAGRLLDGREWNEFPKEWAVQG